MPLRIPHLQTSLFFLQRRTAYGRKKLVTVWRKSDGKQLLVDHRSVKPSKYSRTPFEMSQWQSTPKRDKGKRKERDPEPSEVRFSKTIAWLLRHGAVKEGLDMRSDGYVRVVDLVCLAFVKRYSAVVK